MWAKVRRVAVVDSVDVDIKNFDQITPELSLKFLRVPSLKNFSALHRKLSKCSEEWMLEFLKLGGLTTLLSALELLNERKRWRKLDCQPGFMESFIELECVRCIRRIMNSEAGVCFITNEETDSVRQLACGKFSFNWLYHNS